MMSGVTVKLDTVKLMMEARKRGLSAELLCFWIKRQDLVSSMRSGEPIEVPYRTATELIRKVTPEGKDFIIQDYIA